MVCTLLRIHVSNNLLAARLSINGSPANYRFVVFIAHCLVHHWRVAELVTQRPWRKHFPKLAEFRHPSSLRRPNEWSMSTAIRSKFAAKSAESHRKLTVFFLCAAVSAAKIQFHWCLLPANNEQQQHTKKNCVFQCAGQYAHCCWNLLNIWLQLCRIDLAHRSAIMCTRSLARQSIINIYCSINKVACSLGHLQFVGARWGAAAMTMSAHSIYRIINGAENIYILSIR